MLDHVEMDEASVTPSHISFVVIVIACAFAVYQFVLNEGGDAANRWQRIGDSKWRWLHGDVWQDAHGNAWSKPEWSRLD